MKVKDLIHYAKGNGYDVTERQIYLWSKNIYLPEPIMRNEGRGKGIDKEYPEETLNFILGICRLQDKGVKKYDDLTWGLFIHQYPIPPHRIREVMRNKYSQVPIKTYFEGDKQDLFKSLIFELINKACLNKEFEKQVDEFREIFNDGMATCLGSGNYITMKSSNHPETVAIINDERNNLFGKEIERALEEAFINSNKCKDNNPLLSINYSLPRLFNNKLLRKLIFSQRFSYMLNVIISTYKQLDIRQAIEYIPNNVILDYQKALMPVDGDIEEFIELTKELFNPYDSILSIFLPIIWNINNLPEFVEFKEWFVELEDIQDEPWYKNSPIRTIARMLHSLKHTTEIIMK